MNGWMGGWMDALFEWMDECMNGYIYCISYLLCTYVHTLSSIQWIGEWMDECAVGCIF